MPFSKASARDRGVYEKVGRKPAAIWPSPTLRVCSSTSSHFLPFFPRLLGMSRHRKFPSLLHAHCWQTLAL